MSMNDSDRSDPSQPHQPLHATQSPDEGSQSTARKRRRPPYPTNASQAPTGIPQPPAAPLQGELDKKAKTNTLNMNTADILARVQGPKTNWRVVGPTIAAVLFCIVYVGGAAAMRSMGTIPDVKHAIMVNDQGFDMHLKNHKVLVKAGFGPTWGQRDDAAAFMERTIPWKNRDGSEWDHFKAQPSQASNAAKKSPESFPVGLSTNSLAIDKEAMRSIRKWGDTWPSQQLTADMQELLPDLTRWFVHLKKYDHWSLETVGPYADILRKNAPRFTELPVVDDHMLAARAKIYLLGSLAQAKGKGDSVAVDKNATATEEGKKSASSKIVAGAFATVRHFAALVGSRETIAGEHARLSLLRDLALFAAVHTDIADKKIRAWAKTPLHLIGTAKSTMATMQQKTSLFGQIGRWKGLFGSKWFRTGRCAVLSESLLYAAMVRPIIGDRYKARYARMHKGFKKARRNCRLDFAWSVFVDKSKAARLYAANRMDLAPNLSSWGYELPMYKGAFAERFYLEILKARVSH